MTHEVQFFADGFFDPTAKTDVRFSGSLADCKAFLKKIQEKLEEKGPFYGAFIDELTLEIRGKKDNEPTLEKYIIAGPF